MKNKTTKIFHRIICMFLVAMIAICSDISCCSVAYAAAPSVSVDETVYVNLGWYGDINNVSVVKGCSLNGNSSFPDFGTYEDITNMSGFEKPESIPGGVKWNIKNPKDYQRFYFGGALKKNAIKLPWSFDVEYKLNGIPTKAEELAGVSGLVEINIHAIPNNAAKDYHRNNMLLQVAMYVDLEDAYSLEAPGSQLQSIGSKKAVVFSALPGEDITFTVRIGTESFESLGITMMMMPGTLEQLTDIKDIKEAKDTLEGSSNAIYTSMNEILATMELMNYDIGQLKTGTEGMQAARNSLSSSKQQLYDDFDQTIEELDAVNSQLENLIPYLQTSRRMIKAINNDIEDINDTLEEYKGISNSADSFISSMQSDLSALSHATSTLSSQIEDMLTSMGEVAAMGGATDYEIAELQGQAAMASTLDSYVDEINSLFRQTINMGNTTKDIIEFSNDLTENMNDAGKTINRYEDDMIDMLGDVEKLTELTNTSLSTTLAYLSYSKSVLQQTSDILDPAAKTSLDAMIGLLDKSVQNIDDIRAMKKANSEVKNTIDEQFDKFEDENQFINLDAEAPLESFTSDKNPEPSSIQVVLRTDEISLDDDEDTTDIETEKENIGVWGRIVAIFAKIKDKICNLI